MEFVDQEEVMQLLGECGVQELPEGDDCIYLNLNDDGNLVRLHLACPESSAQPHPDAKVIHAAADQLPAMIEHILQGLRLDQVLLFPVGQWRKVFDAVAFSLASHEDWQEVDAMATVKLNGRDPLLCDPGDFKTLGALMAALFTDADQPDQGLIITTTATAVVIELIPEGAVRVCLGNAVLADEVAEILAV